MQLEGKLVKVRFKNEVNSYTIADFETDEELTTIVGYLPVINEGDTLKLIGKLEWKNLEWIKIKLSLF